MNHNISLLNEGARDNMLAVYIPLFQKRGANPSVSELKQFLLRKFVNEALIRQLSERSNYYLAGVARYYFNGDLTKNKKLNALYPKVKDKFDEDICTRLNALIGVLRTSYIDTVGTQFEQPEDFGTLSLKQLLRKYNKRINQELGIEGTQNPKEEERFGNDTRAGKKYTYDILYSFDDAKKYYGYTEPGAWCITYGQQHYNTYVRSLGIHYVVFAMNGFENVPRKIGKGFTKSKPHDTYGNSLICVLQSNKSPEPIYITSRWNHGSYVDGTDGTEADHAYTKEEFLNVIGCDESVLERVFQQWKRNKPKEDTTIDRKAVNKDKLRALRNFKYAQMLINGGMQLKDLPRELISNGYYIEKNEKNPEAGIIKLETNVNGKYYYTIMDRKQIKFNDVMVSGTGGYGYSNGITYSRNYYSNNNAPDSYMLFTVDGYRNSVHMIYDKIRHRFIDIDGYNKFKYVGDELVFGGYQDRYTIVAVNTKQLALVDLAKGKPVKTRTGSVWFEGIVEIDSYTDFNVGYNGRDMRIPRLKPYSILKMTYDSSADIKYVFSIKRGGFIDMRDSIGKFAIDTNDQEFLKDGYLKYCTKVKNGNSQLTIERLMNMDTEEWFTLPENGSQTFSGLRRMEIGRFTLWALTLPNGLDVYFFKNQNRIVFEDTEMHKYHLAYVRNFFQLMDNKNVANMLFNPYTGEFYRDPKGDIKFRIEYRGCDPYIVHPETGEKFKIPYAESAAEVQKESIKNKFNVILENLNRRAW